ncbi:MAG TPA: hypothetical protein VIC55_05125 [Gemmatimonadaceae bacterium]
MPILSNSLHLPGALALLALAACGDATTPRSVLPFAFTDPVGDTITEAADAQAFMAVDARRVSGYVTRDSLILSIVFTAPIAPPAARAPNSVAAIVELDADADSTTGVPPYTGPFAGDAHLGIEYVLVVPDEAGTGVEVRDIVLQQTTSYPVRYDGDSLTVRLPITAVATFNTPLHLLAVTGTTQRPTDIVPDGGYVAVDRLTPSASRNAMRDVIRPGAAGKALPGRIPTPWSRGKDSVN